MNIDFVLTLSFPFIAIPADSLSTFDFVILLSGVGFFDSLEEITASSGL